MEIISIGATASSGGISYTQKTITTGVLASGGAATEDFNITGCPNIGMIDYLVLQQLNDDGSVGDADNPSNQVRVTVYTDDTFGTVQTALVGTTFSSYTMTGDETAANTINGIRQQAGGSTLICPTSYVDEDSTGEIHLRVLNGSFADEGKFKITLYIREIS